MDEPLLASTRAYWTATLLLAAVDAGFISVLTTRLSRDDLHHLRRTVVFTAFGFWSVLWGASFWGDAWASSYRLVLPATVRIVLPASLVLLATTLTLLLLRLLPRLPGPPVPWLCLLGALALQPERWWELWDLDMLHKVPALHGIAPPALVTYSFTEAVLYWCMILALAPLVRAGMQRLLDRLS